MFEETQGLSIDFPQDFKSLFSLTKNVDVLLMNTFLLWF